MNETEIPNIAREVLIIAMNYPPAKASLIAELQLFLAAYVTLVVVDVEAHIVKQADKPEQRTPNTKERPINNENLNPEVGFVPILNVKLKGLSISLVLFVSGFTIIKFFHLSLRIKYYN